MTWWKPHPAYLFENEKVFWSGSRMESAPRAETCYFPDDDVIMTIEPPPGYIEPKNVGDFHLRIGELLRSLGPYYGSAFDVIEEWKFATEGEYDRIQFLHSLGFRFKAAMYPLILGLLQCR